MIREKTGPELYTELEYWATWPPETPPVCSLNESIVQVARNARAEIERLRSALLEIEALDQRQCSDSGKWLRAEGIAHRVLRHSDQPSDEVGRARE